MSMPTGFPTIAAGEYAMLVVDGLTGIVLTEEGKRALISDTTSSTYRVFSSLEEATSCARQLVSDHPEWECTLFDHNATVVETHRDRDPLHALAGARPRLSWWRRWLGS